jgi:hypothetical protein
MPCWWASGAITRVNVMNKRDDFTSDGCDSTLARSWRRRANRYEGQGRFRLAPVYSWPGAAEQGSFCGGFSWRGVTPNHIQSMTLEGSYSPRALDEMEQEGGSGRRSTGLFLSCLPISAGANAVATRRGSHDRSRVSVYSSR